MEDAQNTQNNTQKPKSRLRQTLEGIVIAGALAAVVGIAAARTYEIHSTDKKMRALPVVEYTIKPGETIWGVSYKFISPEHRDDYNRQEFIEMIMQNSGITDPSKIQPGQRIYLPVQGMPAPADK